MRHLVETEVVGSWSDHITQRLMAGKSRGDTRSRARRAAWESRGFREEFPSGDPTFPGGA
jgi:hypothetical protein